MRYLILSDVHSNIEALEAVLSAARGEYERVLCCGDLVGYGPDPNAVVEWARTGCAAIVRGNHDKACTADAPLEWFNPVAQRAAAWTRQALTEENRLFTAALPRGPLMVADFELVHGAPFDEDVYVSNARDAAGAFEYLERNVAFFGHTHNQGGYIWNRSRVETIPRMGRHESSRELYLESGCAYLVNPGSVGQPRDSDTRAAYLLYDEDARVAHYRRVEYDVETTQRKMREAGLPRTLVERLSAGW